MSSAARVLDRLYWVVWVILPFAILETAGIRPIDLIRAPASISPGPPLATPLSALEPWGRLAFWGRFAFDNLVFATGMALGHWVVHRAAQGRVFTADILVVVRSMGWLLLLAPVAGIVFDNLINLAFARANADPFAPYWFPDPILAGYGLFLLAIAAALKEAIRLRQEADLTI